MESITDEQFEFVFGWDLGNATTVNLIRDGGWAVRDTGGVSQKEYMNVTTLGSFNDPLTDQAYYRQGISTTTIDVVLTGEVNQAVQIYSAPALEDFDYRTLVAAGASPFVIFLREQEKTYDSYDLTTEQNIAALTYKKYAMPLSNGVDLNVIASDSDIDTLTPYTNMNITWYATPQSRSIGGTNYFFNVIIDGANATKQQIYSFVQRQLRKTTNINAGTGTYIGSVTEELLEFVGPTLLTKFTTYGGVYIDNFANADINDLVFRDNDGDDVTFPYTAAGAIVFNDNLTNSPDAVYRTFFQVGFDTASAIIVNDASSNPISGNVSSHVGGRIEFTYDYDFNDQRGPGSEGTDAPVTVVAIGTTFAQYVRANATIQKSTQNTITLVAPLERNYSNPA
jgi:hypothetical protein